MNYLEQNLKALRANDSETALWVESADIPSELIVADSKSGFPVPKVGNVSLHSGYHPEKEGVKLTQDYPVNWAGCVVVFGFGFGYHLEAIDSSSCDIIVIEPSAGVLKAAFEARDLVSLLSRIKIISPAKFADSASSLDYTKTLWIDHEPSAQLYKHDRDLLAEPFIVHTLAATRKYKAMVVGPVYGGSTTTAASTARALTELGFIVDFVDNTSHHAEALSINDVTPDEINRAALKSGFNNYLGDRIVARADHFKPDVIVVLAQSPLNPSAIDKLKVLNIPVVFWFVENYHLLPYWKLVAPHYDYFFGMQKGSFLDELVAAGASYAGYLPQAADPFVHRPAELSESELEKYGSEISFMGAGYPNRQKFFSGFLDTPLKIWGTEWNLSSPLGQRVMNANRRLNPDEYVKIFNASAINLNLHSSNISVGVDHDGDFVNPRTFEIAACEAFQLVDMRSELAKMFIIGKEIATFQSMDELREKIDYYLKRPDEREAIAHAGRKRVMREHTFVHRMARMMSVVLPREEERIENARDQRRGVNDVDYMIERTSNVELKAFLKKFSGEGNISLKNVMDEISRGKGPLSRPEAIFVMVNQVLAQG